MNARSMRSHFVLAPSLSGRKAPSNSEHRLTLPTMSVKLTVLRPRRTPPATPSFLPTSPKQGRRLGWDLSVDGPIYAGGTPSGELGRSPRPPALRGSCSRPSVVLSSCVCGPSSDGQDLRAARRAVEHPVGQVPHLGMVALTGVDAQGDWQIDYVPQGLKRGAEQGQGAVVAAGEAGSPGDEQARFAKRADDVVQSG